MARRLSPDDRRAEIIAKTHELIATTGPTGLSLRSVARYCGISAPGLLHHFDGLQSLLETVLAQRDAEEYAAAATALSRIGSDVTVLDLGDALVEHIAANAVESRNFDALEAQAIASTFHPAHEYYTRDTGGPNPATIALAARDYTEPEEVVRVLLVLVDGMRHRWLRSSDTPDYIGDWQRLRPTVEAGFGHLRRPRTEPPTR